LAYKSRAIKSGEIAESIKERRTWEEIFSIGPLPFLPRLAERLPQHFYYDAEFKTKGFTLKAPKIRVKDTPSRVKVTVLAKVK
jgi:hypothetical protein